MKTEQSINHLSYILVYAAIWGVLEATLGWALHFIPVPLSGIVMFPLAMAILMRAYRRFESTGPILAIAVIAAAIKLIDLFLPGLPAIKTINPATALLIEGVFAAIVMPRLAVSSRISRVGYSLAVNFGWRAAFMLFALFIQIQTGKNVAILKSTDAMLTFLVFNGIISSILTWGVATISAHGRNHSAEASLPILKYPLSVAMPLIVIATGLQYLL